MTDPYQFVLGMIWIAFACGIAVGVAIMYLWWLYLNIQIGDSSGKKDGLQTD